MKTKQPDRPFAIDLELPFLQQMTAAQKTLDKRSVSELIREALDEFDAEAYEPDHPPHVQISVRIPGEVRKQLKKIAQSRHVSEGELVRVAIETYMKRHVPAGAKKRKAAK